MKKSSNYPTLKETKEAAQQILRLLDSYAENESIFIKAYGEESTTAENNCLLCAKSMLHELQKMALNIQLLNNLYDHTDGKYLHVGMVAEYRDI